MTITSIRALRSSLLPTYSTAASKRSLPAAKSLSTTPTRSTPSASRTDRPSCAGRPPRWPSTPCPSTTPPTTLQPPPSRRDPPGNGLGARARRQRHAAASATAQAGAPERLPRRDPLIEFTRALSQTCWHFRVAETLRSRLTSPGANGDGRHSARRHRLAAHAVRDTLTGWATTLAVPLSRPAQEDVATFNAEFLGLLAPDLLAAVENAPESRNPARLAV